MSKKEYIFIIVGFIFVCFCLLVITQAIKIEPNWIKIYVKEIQITSQGIAILTVEEMKGEKRVQSVLVLSKNEQNSKIYSGNVKYKKDLGGYVFIDNND